MKLSITTRPPRILAVFAHPDDESICAGGTLAKYAAEGAEIMVVSATRGDAGQIHDAGAAPRRTLGRIREQELRLACRRLGIRHVACLDYGDGTLDRLAPQLLARHITQLIRSFRPAIVLTFGPDGAYGHPDHIAIGAATTVACDMAGDAMAFTEQLADGLTLWKPDAVYHCYFPPGRVLLRDLLAQWLNTHERRLCGSQSLVNALPLLAKELSVLGYIADHVDVQWYPAGFSIVEQGEAATRLHLILEGTADEVREDQDGQPHVLAQLERGSFFGQHGLAHGQPAGAHVVARSSVTCLVFAPGAPTAFAGRGSKGGYAFELHAADGEALYGDATTAIDVADYVEHKIAAIAAHRTQCPIEPDMLPLSIFRAILGCEYFVRIEPAQQLETELLARKQPVSLRWLSERFAVPAAA